MEIYLIDNANKAMQIRHLLKLNAECARLHWSKTVTDIPSDVISSLGIIESFIENRVYEICTNKISAITLTEDEEALILSLIKENSELKATLGTGVVLAGEEADALAKALKEKGLSEKIVKTVTSGEHVVFF